MNCNAVKPDFQFKYTDKLDQEIKLFILEQSPKVFF